MSTPQLRNYRSDADDFVQSDSGGGGSNGHYLGTFNSKLQL